MELIRYNMPKIPKTTCKDANFNMQNNTSIPISYVRIDIHMFVPKTNLYIGTYLEK